MNVRGTQDTGKDEARLFFDLGPSAADPVIRVLEPGETIRSPETHLLLMHGDLDAVIQELQHHLRHYILPPVPPGVKGGVKGDHWGGAKGNQ